MEGKKKAKTSWTGRDSLFRVLHIVTASGDLICIRKLEITCPKTHKYTLNGIENDSFWSAAGPIISINLGEKGKRE